MSAVPKPEPDPTPEPADADGWVLLESLRRRLDDQAVQGRKTQQQVTQLAESIGALVEVQRRRSRWLNLNSFVAYVLFTLLVGAGFYFLYTSRAHELVEARDGARRERDNAVRRADDASAKLAAREQADTRAWEVYQLLEAGKRSEATTKLASLGALPLSRTERAVLAARAHETQVMEVDAALKAAAAAFKLGRHADAIPQLEAALVGEPSGARASSMRYFLGVAYAMSGELEKAIVNLQTALAVEAEHDDVRFHLASALDRSGAYAKARVEYDRFATAHPQSSFAAFAMRRSATLARMPAQAPAKPAAAPTTPPAPTTQPAPTPPTTAPAPSLAKPPSAAPQKPVWKPKAKPAAKPAAPAPAPTDATPPAPASPLPPPTATSTPSPSSWSNQPMGHVDARPLSPTKEPPSALPAPSHEPKPSPPSAMPAPSRDPKPAPPPEIATPSPEPGPAKPSPPERTPPPEVATPAPRPHPPITPPLERVAAE